MNWLLALLGGRSLKEEALKEAYEQFRGDMELLRKSMDAAKMEAAKNKKVSTDIEKRLKYLELEYADKENAPIYIPFIISIHQAIIEKQLSDEFFRLREEGKISSTTSSKDQYNHLDFNRAIEIHTDGSCYNIETDLGTARCPYYTGGPQWWAKESNTEYRQYLRFRVVCRLQGYKVIYNNIDQRVDDPKRIWNCKVYPDPWTISPWANDPIYNLSKI